MAKQLSEMTLEELWQLFPIILTPHDPKWKVWYGEEVSRLAPVLGLPQVRRVSHIGSTAVEGIWAKPIVDILAEVSPDCDLGTLKALPEQNGYICMAQSEDRLSFNRGYTPEGFAQKVFHLHLRRLGDCDELYFRDYLLDHPEAAVEYEKLKLSLWKHFEHDRDGYTAAKGELVARLTREAKALYRGRY